LRPRCCLTRRIYSTLLSSFATSPGISTCCAAVSSAARTVCCWSRCLGFWQGDSLGEAFPAFACFRFRFRLRFRFGLLLLFRSSCCFRLRFLLELDCGPWTVGFFLRPCLLGGGLEWSWCWCTALSDEASLGRVNSLVKRLLLLVKTNFSIHHGAIRDQIRYRQFDSSS
jgi:hypothetical protein